MIEFLGVSRSGKTSQMRMVKERLVCQGYDVATVQRPDIPFSNYASLYDFHRSLVAYFLGQVALNTHRDFVLLDRGFLDRQTLAKFDFTRGAISSGQYQSIVDATEREIQRTDRFFLFVVPEAISLGRLVEQARQGLDNSHLNGGLSIKEEDELSALIPMYLEVQKTPRLTVIDGTKNLDQNNDLILKEVPQNGFRRSRTYC